MRRFAITLPIPRSPKCAPAQSRHPIEIVYHRHTAMTAGDSGQPHSDLVQRCLHRRNSTKSLHRDSGQAGGKNECAVGMQRSVFPPAASHQFHGGAEIVAAGYTYHPILRRPEPPGPTAGCGRPHVRWYGRGNGLNPATPPAFQISASLLQEISVVIIVVAIALSGRRHALGYDIALRIG